VRTRLSIYVILSFTLWKRHLIIFKDIKLICYLNRILVINDHSYWIYPDKTIIDGFITTTLSLTENIKQPKLHKNWKREINRTLTSEACHWSFNLIVWQFILFLSCVIQGISIEIGSTCLTFSISSVDDYQLISTRL